MKKIILIIIIFFITGCTSYTELNDLAIVNTLGIDYINDNYIVYMSLIEKDKIKTYTSINIDYNEAINSIYLTSDKKLYLSHIDLLILTDNSINKINSLIKAFLENNDYRNNFQTVIMNSKDINTFFNNKLDAKKITNLIKTNSKETSISSNKEFETFIKDILKDNSSYLSSISFKNNNLYLDGIILIKDNKIYSKLDKESSIILNILTNNINKAYINGITIYNGNIKVNKKNIDIYLTTDTDDINMINNLKNKISLFLKKYKNNIDFNINIINKKKDSTINGGIYEQ